MLNLSNYINIDSEYILRSAIFLTVVAILIAIGVFPLPWADISLSTRVAYITLASVMLLGPVKVVPKQRIMQMIGSITVFLGIWTYVIQIASLYALAAFVALGTVAIAYNHIQNIRIIQTVGLVSITSGVWIYVTFQASLDAIATLVAIGTIAIASTLLWPEYFD